MKGISLSIETIVILILAVIILAALLIFISPIFTETQSGTTNELKRARLCDAYVQEDPKCNGVGSVDSQITTDLKNVCENLGKCDSLSGVSGADCARDCCIVCPEPLQENT